MKYRLLRDCPHGKAGSVLRKEDETSNMVGLFDEEHMLWYFPKSTFPDWFEEIKEMKKFTREQAEAIKEACGYSCVFRCDMSMGHEIPHIKFFDWLDENTEK